MPLAVDALLFLCGHLLGLVAVAVGSFVLGRQLLGWLDPDGIDEEVALSCCLGLGVLGNGLFLLGLIGLLQRGVVLVAFLAACVLCRRGWRRAAHLLRRAAQRLATERHLRRAALLWLVVLAPLVVLALYPPTQFDESLYHLPYARTFAEQGRLLFMPELRFPVFPQLNEMLFVLGMHLGGDVAARSIQLLTLLITALLIAAWGRRLFSPVAGRLAGALWLGTPLAIWVGTAAMVDVGLTMFVTAALACSQRWAQDKDSEGQLRWLVLAGFFIGCAAASKYLGLFFFAAVILVTAWRSVFRKQRKVPLLGLCLTAVLVAVPCYVRIVAHTGNPVFPYYSSLFGKSEWTPDHPGAGSVLHAEEGAEAVQVAGEHLVRISTGLGFLAMTPWRGVFDREVFHFQAPLSPFSPLLVVLLAPVALLSRRARPHLLLALAYGLFWLTTIRDLRFLLPVLPVLGLALMIPLAQLLNRLKNSTRCLPAQWPALLAAALLLAPGPLYACYKISEQGWLPINTDQREEYLTRRVRGYEALRYLNHRWGDRYTVFADGAEHLTYHADGRFLGDASGPYRYSVIMKNWRHDSRAFYARLRGIGADHLLLMRPSRSGRYRETRLPRDPSFKRHFRLVLATRELLLYELHGAGNGQDQPTRADSRGSQR